MQLVIGHGVIDNRSFDNLQDVIGGVESEFATWTTRNDVLRRTIRNYSRRYVQQQVRFRLRAVREARTGSRHGQVVVGPRRFDSDSLPPSVSRERSQLR
jgi:hypothetical protein